MPHSGGDTLEAIERIGLMNIEDMETLLAGGRPARTLNPEVFDGGGAMTDRVDARGADRLRA